MLPRYDLRALHRNLDIMTTLIKYMQELGWEPYANDHEDGTCQFEANWTYSDALTTADRHTFFKWMVKTLAEESGLLATFMPKPFTHLTGNGAHFHMSLWDAENQTNLFLDDRIPAPGRIENRLGDGAANPYLAATVLLAAGLDGIENQIDPGVQNEDNLYEVPEDELQRRGIYSLPATLGEAADALEQDEVIKDALGTTYADNYIQVKREEWRDYHLRVSEWETDNYLEVY